MTTFRTTRAVLTGLLALGWILTSSFGFAVAARARASMAPHRAALRPKLPSRERYGLVPASRRAATAIPGVDLTNIVGLIGKANPSPGPPSGKALQIGQQLSDLSLSGGSLFGWDSQYSVLRKIDLSTGTETLPLNSPVSGYPISGLQTETVTGAEADPSGNIYAFEPYGCSSCANQSDYAVILIPVGTSSPFMPGKKLVAGHPYVLAGGAQYAALGDSGDGGPANQAAIQNLVHILIDPTGNLLVDETPDIRLVAAKSSDPFLPGKTLTPGDIYTVAGNDKFISGFVCNEPSDGSPATSGNVLAKAMAVTPSGNLLISDECTGLRLIAGTSSDPLMPGKHLTAGDIYTVTSDLANLGGVGLAVDANGDAYVSDSDPSWSTPWIKLIPAGTSNPFLPNQTLTPGNVYTIAGNQYAGTGGWNGDGLSPLKTNFYQLGPFVLNGSNTILVSDQYRIRQISATTGKVTTIAGTGITSEDGVPASQVSSFATQALPDSSGDLIFVDTSDQVIRLMAGGTSSPFL